MDKKIKILETLDSYFPDFNGPTVLVTNYAKILNQKNDCSLLVPKYPNHEDDQPFEIQHCKSMGIYEGFRCAFPFHDKKVKKFIKEGNFDIIHSHSPFPIGNFAAKMGKKLGIPTVVTLHTKFKDDILRLTKSKLITYFVMKYLLRTFNRTDYVWTVSNGAADTLREYGYKGNIEVIRNGTDMKYPDNAEKLVSDVNKQYNLEGKKNVFLFVGRIVETKNLDMLLKALQILKKDNLDFTFLLVGDGSHLEHLKKLAKELDIEDKVIFTGKVMDREKLSGFYLRSDLFLFPSIYDTASLVPLEAASMKLPTLLVEGCQTSETITDNFNGFTAKNDEESWSKRIKEIISEPEKLKEIKEECHKSVYRSWEMVLDEVNNRYLEIIEEYKSKKNNKKSKK